MKQLKLHVTDRAAIGSTAVGRIRKQGGIPAVIYGSGKHAPKALVVKDVDFRTFLRAKGDSAALVEIVYPDQKTALTLIQATQRNAMTDKFMHIDFKEISMTEDMRATLPVHLVGEAYGVKTEAGVIEFLSHTVEVRCLPKNLPEYIEVNITDVKIGDSIHICDLPKISDVTYMGNADNVIIMCAHPKAEEATPIVEAPKPEVGKPAKGAKAAKAKK